MLYLYYAILAAVFFATFAMAIDKGLWSNTLLVINIVLSGLVAFGYFHPVATLAVDNGLEEYTFLLDFIAIWLLYVASFVLLHRVAAGMLSKTRMRFRHPIDPVGGPAMAAVAGWLMTSLVAATLHAAPFAKDCFGGVFADTSRSSALTNPDLAWLSIAQNALSSDQLGSGEASFTASRYVSDFNKLRGGLDKQESLRVKR